MTSRPSPQTRKPVLSGRRRRWFLLALLVLGLLLWWWLRRSHSPSSSSGDHSRARVAVQAPRPRPRRSTTSPSRPIPSPIPPAQQGGPPGKPIIDKILVEKPEVCEGEENLITVLAHTPGHRDDAYLHYRIGSGTGQSVPLRSYKPDREEVDPPERTITVFGRNNVSTTVKVPYFRIKGGS